MSILLKDIIKVCRKHKGTFKNKDYYIGCIRALVVEKQRLDLLLVYLVLSRSKYAVMVL